MAKRAKSSSDLTPAKGGRRIAGGAGKRGFGWVPDLPDHRDLMYSAPMGVMAATPAKIDLRLQCPPVVDQGQLGSCTGNAIAGAHQFDQMKQGLTPSFPPSRLFIYYNERVMEGSVGTDAGAAIRDGIKSIGKQGVCPESYWPYVITKFTHKPPANCYQVAKQHCATL